MTRRVLVFDTTLRDGEQSPGIALAPAAKAEIARALEALGVDVIEAGFAASSPGEAAGVRAVAAAVRTATVCSMARARPGDVEAAAAALAGARRSRIHVVLGTSRLHMERKLRLAPAEVVALARHAVALAARLVDEVEFCCEDATRSDPAFVAEVCRAAVDAGATTVNLPDTVGYALPQDYAELVARVRALLPAAVAVSVHCHDDLGLAVANTLAGVAAGADQVEVTVNGIGERAGNAALEEVAMALRVRADRLDAATGIVPAEIGPASRLVSRLTGYAVPPNKAVVGANAFAHESGIHQAAILEDAATYQIIDPAELGLETTLPLGKHSGRHALAHAAAAAGLRLDRAQLDEAFARFKRLADGGRAVAFADVFPQLTAQMEVA